MPTKKRRTPAPAISARTVIMVIALNLDLDDFSDDDVADEDQEEAGADHGPADRVLQHGPEVGGRDEGHEDGEGDGQDRDDPARGSRLSRERLDLALDPDALADGVGDIVQDL